MKGNSNKIKLQKLRYNCITKKNLSSDLEPSSHKNSETFARSSLVFYPDQHPMMNSDLVLSSPSRTSPL